MKKLAAICVVASATLWGLMGLFVRRFSAAGLSSLEITELRIASGVVLAGLYLLLFDRKKLRIRLRDVWCFLGTGICSLLMFSYCYFRTIQLTSLAVAGVLLYTAPVFVMLMSMMLFREKMTVTKGLALALAVGGCTLVSGVGSGMVLSPLGLGLGLLSGFGYALYSIFGRYAINRGYDSWTITFYTFVFCAAGSSLLCDWSVLGAAMTAEPVLWGWTAAMGVLTAFAAYLLYTWGLQRMQSSRASILASVEPVVAALIGVLVFGERLGAAQAAGITLVLSAIFVLSVPQMRKQSVNNGQKRL